MSYPVDLNNQFVKIKYILNDLEKNKQSSEHINLATEVKKSFADMESATKDLFKVLSKIKK